MDRSPARRSGRPGVPEKDGCERSGHGLHVAFVDATRAQVLAHVSVAAPTVLSDGVGQKIHPSLALPVRSPHSDRLAWCFGGSDIAEPRTFSVAAADGSGDEMLSSDAVCGVAGRRSGSTRTGQSP